MSTSMQRSIGRPFGGRTIPPVPATQVESDPPARPATPTVEPSATDYILQATDPLHEHWVNPHVQAYHAQRSGTRAPTPSPRRDTFAPLRTMNAEQRAAYIAQRDAENAAAAGSDSHPGPQPPQADVPPTPLVPSRYRSSSLQAPVAQGSAQRLSAPSDLPYTPQNSSDPDVSDNARAPSSRGRRPSPIETRIPTAPIEALPTPPLPPIAAPAPIVDAAAFQTPAVRASVQSDVLGSPIHMVPPSRRRSAINARPDVEVEVRGMGVERTVLIRILAPMLTANGATPTRERPA